MNPRGKGGYGNCVLELSRARNWVFQGITIDGGGVCEQSLLHGECGKGVLFLNCTIKNFTPRVPDGSSTGRDGRPAPFVFPGENYQTSPHDYQMAFVNCHFENIKSEVFELKCSYVRIINCTFSRCAGGVRIRHGVGSQVIGCRGLKIVKHRCGPHWSVNNPDAENWLYQGNLPYKGWSDDHIHGGGFNRQCAGEIRITNCQGAIVGKEDGNAKGYKATQNIISPNQQNVTLVPGGEEGTVRKEPPPPPSPRLALVSTRDMPLPADASDRQVAERLQVMQDRLLNPPDELLRAAERTGRDEDEWWLEQFERAVAA
jgi:hypothetical protein